MGKDLPRNPFCTYQQGSGGSGNGGGSSGMPRSDGGCGGGAGGGGTPRQAPPPTQIPEEVLLAWDCIENLRVNWKEDPIKVLEECCSFLLRVYCQHCDYAAITTSVCKNKIANMCLCCDKVDVFEPMDEASFCCGETCIECVAIQTTPWIFQANNCWNEFMQSLINCIDHWVGLIQGGQPGGPGGGQGPTP